MNKNSRPVLSPTAYDVASYVLYLQNSLRAPGSVMNYVSGVKTWFKALGVDIKPFDSYHVNVLKKGLPAAMKHCPSQSSPICPPLVKEMVVKLTEYGQHTNVVKSALLTMYFTLLRQSNLLSTSSARHQPHVLKRRDVIRTNKALFILVRSSKTTKSPQDATRFILPAIPGSKFCPVKAWDDYINFNTLLTPTDPAFQIDTNMPLTAKVMTQVLRSVLKDLGYASQNFFTLHGLRRGAARACQKAGLPLMHLKEAGLWKSDAIFSYIPKKVNKAPRALATYFG